MSDVFDEVMSRVKQKAKYFDEIGEEWINAVLPSDNLWVRLEDVKEAIQQLRQDIVDEIIELIHRLEREIGLVIVDGLGADITDSFIQNLKEELLRENEG